VLDLLEQVKAGLTERGLTATVEGVSWSLLARNPHNSMSQRVSLVDDGAGLCWVWAGFDPEDESRERICAAGAVDEVILRLARTISSHKLATTLGDGNSNRGATVS
jgi:hypothetical protein